MADRQPWLVVDRKGLAAQLERRSKSFVLFELIQNALDEETTRIEVTLEPSETRGHYILRVEDDSPDGFADLAHAWTMFAFSPKAKNPEKRGRFDVGEKFVLALCKWAEIASTTGSVVFDEDEGRAHYPRRKREFGTLFRAIIKMSRNEAQQAIEDAHRIILPAHVQLTLNGSTVEHRRAVTAVRAMLPTEYADEDGRLHRTVRTTMIEAYERRPNEPATVFEMGTPVCETGGDDRWHYNVCVSPETKLLTADLRYIPAAEVSEGMELAGFDEECSKESYRAWRSSTVESTSTVKLPCYQLTFEDGTEITCSADHEWLSTKGSARRWIRTEQMIEPAGDRPGTSVVRALDVWGKDQSYDGGYLAAAFDGEGSLTQTPTTNPVGHVKNRISFSQNENEMLVRIEQALQERGFKTYRSHVDRNVRLSLRSRRDILRFLGTYRPVRLLPKLDLNKLGWFQTGDATKLVSKKFVGLRDVIAIQTSTHTFIAEGLASHNCQRVPLSVDRDSVTPSYLRSLRVHTLNVLHNQLQKGDAASVWAREAGGDTRVAPEAFGRLQSLRFGEKRVMFDPSDLDANQLAASKGYTVVPAGALTRDEHDRNRALRANPETTWATSLPAGQVTPSPKPYSEGGKPVPEIAEKDWTHGMWRVATFATALSAHMLGHRVRVQIVLGDIGWRPLATYGPGSPLTLNLRTLGHRFFDSGSMEEVTELLIHEFAHQNVGEHLMEKFHRECCRLGAMLPGIALTYPEIFRDFESNRRAA